MSNLNLHTAKKNKKDEFYTQYKEIEAEIPNYNLSGMSVYSPCDDYRWSNFTKYFTDHFNELGITKYCCTNYDIGDGAYMYEYDGKTTTVTKLEGDGDFRSAECTAIKDEYDVIITNPPFSLFRDFIRWLHQSKTEWKNFIIIGNQMCSTYNEIAPYFINGQIRYGFSIHSYVREYRVPEDYPLEDTKCREENGAKYISISNSRWFTSFKVKSNWEFVLSDKYKYSPDKYPKYDNYDAIDVKRIAYIPYDYEGEMGVPISILDHLDEDKIELVRMKYGNDGKFLSIEGKIPFTRIIIKLKR